MKWVKEVRIVGEWEEVVLTLSLFSSIGCLKSRAVDQQRDTHNHNIQKTT